MAKRADCCSSWYKRNAREGTQEEGVSPEVHTAVATTVYCNREECIFIRTSGTSHVKGELRAEEFQRTVRRADPGSKGNHWGSTARNTEVEALGGLYVHLRLAVLRTKN